MSLILDALKKAEQDRHAGQAPALDELLVRRAPPVVRRRRDTQQDVLAMAAIIMAVLFALSGLVYWLWPADKAPVAVAAVAASGDENTQPAPALRVDPERLVAPTAEAPEAGVDASDTDATEAATMDELDGDQPVRSSPPAAISEPAVQPSLIAEPTPAPAPVVVESNVRPLKEMPPAFRSEFPKLSVDVHVYDDNPLRRFVLINGKKYRETDTLIDGPKVVEITPNGEVMEQRGSKVQLELPG